MSWFLPSNRRNEIKPTLGQEYRNATGYDDKKAAIYNKSNANLIYESVGKKCIISGGIMESFTDYKSLCAALQLSPLDMIKLLSNKASRMEDVLKFIYNHVKQRTMICSIYIQKEEAALSYHSKSANVTREISKISIGHHVIVCIPVSSSVWFFTPFKETIFKLFDDGEYKVPDFFYHEATALFDYEQVYQQEAKEMFKSLPFHTFMQPATSLFVELPKTDKNYTLHNSDAALQFLFQMLQLIYLLNNSFSLQENINEEAVVSRSSRTSTVSDRIESLVKDLEYSLFRHFPPTMLQALYAECLYYNFCYLLNLSSPLSTGSSSFQKSIATAHRILQDVPYRKHDNLWFIEITNDNSSEFKQKYLKDKWCILVTNKTKDMIKEIYGDKMIWVLSSENQWERATEPLLLFNGKDDFLLGTCEVSDPKKNAHEQGEIFIDHCKCSKTKKAWVCKTCKSIMTLLKNDILKCRCGATEKRQLVKTCYNCQFADKNENQMEDEIPVVDEVLDDVVMSDVKNLEKSMEIERKELPSVPAAKIVIPRTSAISPYVTPATTPTSAAPKPIVPTKKNFNILFIGQSGAGKSMLVNSIYNYLTYNFDEVSKAETVDCILPCQFQLQTPDFKKKVFKAGPQDENEYFNDSGESVTQKPKIYSLNTEKYDCKIIDTPGLGDTRGAKQDEHNLNLIRQAIIGVQELHAIGFVMPSNISKLTSNFEVSMRDLLSLFPKIALKNVFFFFTYANSTFFTIGDTRSTLEEFIATFETTNSAKIPFGIENVCCVDSEAFMYFIATKQGHKYQNRDQESFRISWDKSKAAIETFLTRLENVDPVKSDDILMTYEFEQIGILLQKENDPRLEKLILQILTKVSQISMTSKFNIVKKSNIQNMDEFKEPMLFQALSICKNEAKDPNLKELIKKIIECYAGSAPKDVEEIKTEIIKMEKSKDIEQQNGTVIKTANSNPQNGKKEEEIRPTPPPRAAESSWPCYNRLKSVAEKLGKEWNKGYKISQNAMENVLNVQIAGNLQHKDIEKDKLKVSLDRLLMEVKGDLYNDMKKLHDDL